MNDFVVITDSDCDDMVIFNDVDSMEHGILLFFDFLEKVSDSFRVVGVLSCDFDLARLIDYEIILIAFKKAPNP